MDDDAVGDGGRGEGRREWYFGGDHRKIAIRWWMVVVREYSPEMLL